MSVPIILSIILIFNDSLSLILLTNNESYLNSLIRLFSDFCYLIRTFNFNSLIKLFKFILHILLVLNSNFLSHVHRENLFFHKHSISIPRLICIWMKRVINCSVTGIKLELVTGIKLELDGSNNLLYERK